MLPVRIIGLSVTHGESIGKFSCFMYVLCHVETKANSSHIFLYSLRGEMGFAKIVAGVNMMGIEDHVAWVTPGQWTVENKMPCSEDGAMCGGIAQTHGQQGDPSLPPPLPNFASMEYVDPSIEFMAKKEATGDIKSTLRTSRK